MSEESAARRRLRLLQGGKNRTYQLGKLSCTLVTAEEMPRDIEALVFEEDTHLILTYDGRITYQETHPIRLMNELHQARTHPVGSLVTKGRSWYGVTIDLDSDPVCKPEWVAAVYGEVEEKIRTERISRIGLHLLGCVHGGLRTDLGVDILLSAMQTWRLGQPCSLYLLLPETTLKPVNRLFQQQFQAAEVK